MIHGLLATMLSIPASHAGDPSDCAEHVKSVADADPGRCAKRASYMGFGNCSWSTTKMAERVLHEGAPYTYVGTLVPSKNQLETNVAAPFRVGPEADIHVVANEVLDLLEPNAAIATMRLELQGRVLTVDGVQYFVVTHIVTPAT